jgi:hypothetical protein
MGWLDTRVGYESINCAMLWQLLTSWNGSEDAGALKVIFGEPPL